MLPINSTSTPRRLRSKLASRRSSTVTNLELNSIQLSPHVLTSTVQRGCIPEWRPMLAETDVNLRAVKDFFLPLGGENFDVRDSNGRTSLHEAVQMGYEAVAEYLVLHGASIYAQDDEGVTPLMLANRFGNHKMTALLLGKGHHVQEQDVISRRPIQEMKMTKEDVVKWVFASLNVGVELSLALLSRERRDYYRRFSVTLSFACLLLSVSEMVYEAKKDRVEWKKRGGCYWFYYPGRHGKAFGTLMLWFGLLSSIVQFCLSLLTLAMKKGALEFDYTGLLLSVCYLLSRLGCRKRTMRGVIKCGEHGETEIGGRLQQGRWVFECFLCRKERVV